MKIARTTFMLATLLVACNKGGGKEHKEGGGGGDKAKLEGTWVFDTSRIKEVKMFKDVPPEQLAQLEEMLKGIEVEFKGDRASATMPGEPTRGGTFKVKSQDGDKLVLELIDDEKKETKQITLTITGDSMMYMKEGDPEPMPFKRK